MGPWSLKVIPVRCCVRASAVKPILVKGPPATYNHKSATEQATFQLLKSQYCDLVDLAEKGVLTVIARSPEYVERRSDGYQEPELIFLLGTSHFSQTSAADVERVISAVKPEQVVLEVCRSRTAVMYDPANDGDCAPTNSRVPNLMSLSGPSLAQALLRSGRLGGSSAMLLRAVLSAQAGRVSEALGVRSGVEMRAARRAAEAVGAQIVLGDRPIEITLQRAWAALSWRQRWRLGRLMLGAATQPIEAPDAHAVEAMKEDDVIAAVLSQVSEAFPEVVAPLLHERDMYLAWSLKRSKAVNGTKRVVGVIGKGHLRGVLYHLTHPEASGGLRFRDLVEGKNVKEERAKEAGRAARRLALELALAGGFYVAWSHVFP